MFRVQGIMGGIMQYKLYTDADILALEKQDKSGFVIAVIIQYMLAKKLTQRMLIRKCGDGLTQGMLSRYLSGGCPIPVRKLEAIVTRGLEMPMYQFYIDVYDRQCLTDPSTFGRRVKL
jgi:hypothetical protein